MYLKRINYIIAFLLIAAFTACEAEIEQYTPDAGDIELTTFVALGNSLTAGFADGELYKDGQINSMANILAGQLMHVGLESFRQPLMKDNLGFGGRLVLGVVNGQLMPVPAGGNPSPDNFVNIYTPDAPFHNLGVPGATTQHLLAPGYGTMNPYFGRFASNPASASVIGDAMALNPSFFSLWAGNDDILNFARSGGEGAGITPLSDFETYYNMLLGQLTSQGAKGVIANIPGIINIPFFNTIPFNAIVLADQNIVDALNAAYAAAPHVSFELGPNPLVVEDNQHPAGFRQLQAGELVLLTAMAGISGQGWGTSEFLPAQYYLSLDQVDEIQTATQDYNNALISFANNYGLALADIHGVLGAAETGIFFDAIEFTTAFITGGAFSLDGIHLNARGNAIVANEFIDAINNKYNATIPKVQVGQFSGIIFP
ncbi:MAG: hypothetical protein RG741_03545 [Bacteroidales bacterium]|nr:hypothetical protein [Bacteroidales bacterium]